MEYPKDTTRTKVPKSFEECESVAKETAEGLKSNPPDVVDQVAILPVSNYYVSSPHPTHKWHQQ